VATVFSSLASKLVAMVSPSLASRLVVAFLVEPQNHGGGGFPSLSLKTGSSGLVIWASKSPQRFLGFGLKTKQASVCRLHHKTDGAVSQLERTSFSVGQGLGLNFSTHLQRPESLSAPVWFSGGSVCSSLFWRW
jgi:hypothetical protein